jgi:phosphatidylserine/phosphatidylglycerophosphate/cardiolipin synthase-like enzyme
MIIFLFTFKALAGEAPAASAGGNIKAVFNRSCDELLIDEIGNAKSNMVVAIYSFTHQRIAKAFAKAAARGVEISLKYDESQADWPGMKDALKILEDAGIKCVPIKMTNEHSGMHNKFTVIDGQKVLTGSFNYTAAGDQLNYENLVLISSKPIAEAYAKEFESIKSR